MNAHLAEIGANERIISASGEIVLTDAEISAGVCSKCSKNATYFSCFNLHEKLLCDDHAAICMRKNASLPPSMWFCKPWTNEE